MVYYFSYGSNLFSKRIQNTCPSARAIAVGEIKNYKFMIGKHFSKNWKGNVSTIVPDKNNSVFGVVWHIKDSEIHMMDIQEAVAKNVYNTAYIPVHMKYNNKKEVIYCYVYIMCEAPCKYDNNLPSMSYLNTIIQGAKEHLLPSKYIKYLESFSHNDSSSISRFPNVN